MSIARQILEGASVGLKAATSAQPVSSALSAKVRTSGSTLYIKTGDTFLPRPSIPTPFKKLPAGVYEVNCDHTGQVYIKPHEIQTDELIRFNDPRHRLVLNEIDKFWKAKSRFKEAGFTHKRGMLLTGQPGCGKTCLLKQVMEDVIEGGDVVIYTANPHDLKRAIRAIKDVEESRNILVIMEDVDSIIQYSEQGLLQLMDGDDQNENVLIMCTTNYPDRIPPRLMRPGRFDRKLEIGPIPKDGRRAYFMTKMARFGSISENSVNEYVELTEGFSFAQMREFLVSVVCLGYSTKDSAARVRSGTIEEALTEEQVDAKLKAGRIHS